MKNENEFMGKSQQTNPSGCSGNCDGCSSCDDQMTVTLELDNGETCECAILTILEVGEQNYIVLLPQNPTAEEEGEVYIYRYIQDANGNPDLANIEDDDEFEVVSEAFDEWLDESEYDEIVGEDELDEDAEEE